ncbi:NPCBM/NEW2 domain-containing protein [bacterium]|nr:NPCBM/NEW2 domain-containing protein [bacterium]
MRRSTLVAAALAMASLASPRASRADEVRDVSGRSEEQVVSISQEKGLTVVKTGSGRTIPLDKVKEISFDDAAPGERGSSTIVLANGDVLRGEIGAGTESAVEIDTPSLGKVKVDLDVIAAVFHDVAAEKEHKLVLKHLGKLGGAPGGERFALKPNKDLLLLKSADAKTAGSVRTISRKGVVFPPTFEKTPVPLSQVEAVIFTGQAQKMLDEKLPAPAAGKTIVRLRCADGSVVTGTVSKLVNGKLELHHALGELTLPTSERKEVPGQLLTLLVENGAFTYLSDLVPTKVAESFPEGFDRDAQIFGWKRDAEVVSGEPLSLGRRTFEKGLGVHTQCSLTYDLRGAWSKLRVTVGVDDQASRAASAHAASVVFRVLVDGKPAKEIAAGLTKRTGEAPTDLEIKVEGAKSLELVVDYADSLHILGRADWADAHLVK